MTFAEENIFEFLNDGQSHVKFKILKSVKDKYRTELEIKEIHETLTELINHGILTIERIQMEEDAFDRSQKERTYFKSNYTI